MVSNQYGYIEWTFPSRNNIREVHKKELERHRGIDYNLEFLYYNFVNMANLSRQYDL